MDFQKIISKISIVHIIIISILLILILWYINNLNNTKKTAEKFTNYPEPQKPIQAEIILYYASWCGYSRIFLPEWEKFEQWIKDNAPHIKISSIRCESGNEETCFQKGITGYPTVILYPVNGSEVTFNKERTSNNLVAFIKENGF